MGCVEGRRSSTCQSFQVLSFYKTYYSLEYLIRKHLRNSTQHLRDLSGRLPGLNSDDPHCWKTTLESCNQKARLMQMINADKNILNRVANCKYTNPKSQRNSGLFLKIMYVTYMYTHKCFHKHNAELSKHRFEHQF